jgi:hypothetical protein
MYTFVCTDILYQSKTVFTQAPETKASTVESILGLDLPNLCPIS